jgi:hypothetical protein
VRKYGVVLWTVSALLALQARSFGQCFDFTDGWGTPGNGVDGEVKALRVFNDGFGPQLFAAGAFNGSPHPVLKSWDGANWTTVGVTLFSTGVVSALAEWNDGSGPALYVGGSFTDISGVAANHVAKWDGTAWSPLGAGVSDSVRAFAVFDDGSGEQLYVGGYFSTAGGVSAPRVARWNGSTWSSFGTVPNNVLALAVYDYGSGPSLFAVGQASHPLRRWTGSAWTTIQGIGGLTGGTWSLAVHDDGSGLGPCLFVGGTFTGVDDNLVRWNATGWHPIPGTLGAGVSALGVWQEGGSQRLFVAGPNSFDGTDFNQLARWNGTSWSGVGSGVEYVPGCPREVHAIGDFDDGAGSRLFVGGDFCSAGGKPASGLARFGEPCVPVTINVQPQSVVATFGDLDNSIDFDVEATGTLPLAYQWRRNGVALIESDDIQDTTTPTLHLRTWSLGDAGTYDCVVSNVAGSVVSASATLSVPTSPVGQVLEVTPLLRRGDAVPGLPAGAEFLTLHTPAASSDDGLTFRAEVSVPLGTYDRWFTHLSSSGVELLVRAGDQAPGCAPGVLFDYANFIQSSVPISGGRVAFVVGLWNWTTPGGNRALYFKDSSGLTLVALGGEAAAGFSAGEVWREFRSLCASDDGSIWFTAEVLAGANYVGRGVWRWTSATGAQLILLEGAAAPASGETLLSLAQYSVAAATTGQAALLGVVDSYHGALSGGVFHDSVLWSVAPGGVLQERVRTGDPAPGFGPNFVVERLTSVQVADSGLMALCVQVVEPGGVLIPAIYRVTPGGLELIAFRGQAPPEGVPPGPAYWLFEPRAISPSGQIVFYAQMTSSCECPEHGLFHSSGGVVRTVAVDETDPLPNEPSGFEVVDLGMASVNDLGHVVVGLSIAPASSYDSLWGWSADTGLFPIVTPGRQADLGAGEYATLWFAGSATGANDLILTHSTGHALNEQDEVTFRATSFHPLDMGMFLRVPFEYLRSVHRGPGELACAGDGSGTACPCANPGAAGHGCENSTGEGALLEAEGTVRVAADDLAFSAEGMPANASALLFQGSGLLQAAGIPFKDGIKCAGGLTRRFGVNSTGAFGAAAWGPTLAVHGQWSAGQTRYFQVWFRDPSGPCNHYSNTTNALRVTFTP